MGKLRETSKEETTKDLWDYLVNFWMSICDDPEADRALKMKASEFLARFVLLQGVTRVSKRKEPTKPSMAEILRLAEQFESKDEV